MKLIHLSDLHIGKRWNDFSMIEDQAYILEQILQIIDEEKPTAVMLSGDIYDRSVPSNEAVELFDDFIVKLSRRNLEVFVISGNHDSAERIAFGSRIMDGVGIHFSPVYNGQVVPTVLTDEYGSVNIYMLPFVKPSTVRRFFPDSDITSYESAVKTAISEFKVDTSVRNVLITHQFITGASRSDSEDISVGGTDNIDVKVFDDFDYVALGHIHGPQNIGSPRVRYCGTPLKYSLSEKDHQKSVTVVELGEKSQLNVRTVPLVPLHNVAEIRGTFEQIFDRSFYENTTLCEDYVCIVLTDEDDVVDAHAKLRKIYKRIVSLEYDNARTRSQVDIDGALGVEAKSPFELCAELFELQNGSPMTNEQERFLQLLIERIWGNEDETY